MGCSNSLQDVQSTIGPKNVNGQKTSSSSYATQVHSDSGAPMKVIMVVSKSIQTDSSPLKQDDQGMGYAKAGQQQMNPEDTSLPASAHKFMRFYTYPNKLVQFLVTKNIAHYVMQEQDNPSPELQGTFKVSLLDKSRLNDLIYATNRFYQKQGSVWVAKSQGGTIQGGNVIIERRQNNNQPRNTGAANPTQKQNHYLQRVIKNVQPPVNDFDMPAQSITIPDEMDGQNQYYGSVQLNGRSQAFQPPQFVFKQKMMNDQVYGQYPAASNAPPYMPVAPQVNSFSYYNNSQIQNNNPMDYGDEEEQMSYQHQSYQQDLNESSQNRQAVGGFGLNPNMPSFDQV